MSPAPDEVTNEHKTSNQVYSFQALVTRLPSPAKPNSNSPKVLSIEIFEDSSPTPALASADISSRRDCRVRQNTTWECLENIRSLGRWRSNLKSYYRRFRSCVWSEREERESRGHIFIIRHKKPMPRTRVDWCGRFFSPLRCSGTAFNEWSVNVEALKTWNPIHMFLVLVHLIFCLLQGHHRWKIIPV